MSQGNDIAPLVRLVVRRSLGLTLAAAAVLYLWGNASWARGMALGGLVSAANFALMAFLLPRAIGPSRRRAEGWSLLSLSVRLGLMAAALLLANLFPKHLALIPCALGLFTVQASILGGRLLGPPDFGVRSGE